MHATQPLVRPEHPIGKPDDNPATTLHRAAEHLARHGWIQNALFGDTSPQPAACAIGAIVIAAYGHPNNAPYFDEFDPDEGQLAHGWHRFVTAEAALIKYLGFDCIDPNGDVFTVQMWNDCDGRTADDVIATLHAAAAQLEQAPEVAA